MSDIPIEVDGQEKIVRVILCPSHVRKNGTLKPAAYRSKAGTDEVSVIRRDFVDSNFCKRKAKELDKPQAKYIGLAITLVGDVRAAGSQVVDSRAVYHGHAHISHGFVLDPNEPADSVKSLLIIERCRAIISSASFYEDPLPHSEAWTGPNL